MFAGSAVNISGKYSRKRVVANACVRNVTVLCISKFVWCANVYSRREWIIDMHFIDMRSTMNDLPCWITWVIYIVIPCGNNVEFPGTFPFDARRVIKGLQKYPPIFLLKKNVFRKSWRSQRLLDCMDKFLVLARSQHPMTALLSNDLDHIP